MVTRLRALIHGHSGFLGSPWEASFPVEGAKGIVVPWKIRRGTRGPLPRPLLVDIKDGVKKAERFRLILQPHCYPAWSGEDMSERTWLLA